MRRKPHTAVGALFALQSGEFCYAAIVDTLCGVTPTSPATPAAPATAVPRAPAAPTPPATSNLQVRLRAQVRVCRCARPFVRPCTRMRAWADGWARPCVRACVPVQQVLDAYTAATLQAIFKLPAAGAGCKPGTTTRSPVRRACAHSRCMHGHTFLGFRMDFVR
jgi:hypothetical protein